MKISTAFPSEYFRAADLDGRNVRVIMDRVEMKDIGGDHKPALFFQGKDKSMILNKTNSTNIAAAYGDDTDDWSGKELILFEAMVDFQGKTVPAIRVRAPTIKDRRQQQQQNTGEQSRAAPSNQMQQRQEREYGGGALSEDIPFMAEWR